MNGFCCWLQKSQAMAACDRNPQLYGLNKCMEAMYIWMVYGNQ